MKLTVFWDVVQLRLVDKDGRFRDAYSLHHEVDEIYLMRRAVSISETSVNEYQNTRRNIPKDSHLQIFRMAEEKYLKENFCFAKNIIDTSN
jgi:hypothetical protein